MVFRRLKAKLKRPPSPAIPISSAGLAQPNNGAGTPTPTGPSNTTPGDRNLWLEAFDKLPQKLQLELERRGIKISDPLIDQIESFQKEAQRLRDQSLARDWKVQIGEHEIPIRQTAVGIVHWATKIGDVAIQFSPSPGAGAWAVAKSILQEIGIFDTERSALLSVVDKVASAMFCGQVYYEIYTPDRTGREDVVNKLHDTLVDLYACVLDLLVTSTDLSSNTAVQFCRAVFDTKKPSAKLSELQGLEQDLAAAAVKCEITAHACQDDIVKKYLQEAEDSLRTINRNVEQVLQWVSEHERRSLLEWISTIQYGRHHDEIEEKRNPNTGDWLIQHPKFCEWMESPKSGALWLQGSPGAGKTYLTSAVAKHIGATMSSQMEGFAFFFCNRDEQNRRQALSVLRSLVRQLAAPKDNTQSVRKSLQEARQKTIGRASELGLSDCHGQLLESFNLYPRTFIVLDALDEVLDDELDLLMEKLDDLVGKTEAGNKVKLFVASRPEKEIARMYGSGPTVIINAGDNKADIERFVKMEMDTIEKRYPNSDVALMKEKITTTILDKCDNMFLWAALQVKQVTRCDSIDSVTYALETLPRGLNAAYDQIHSKIQDRPLPERELAERTIKWVMCAPSPLSTEELLGAVQISLEKDQIKLVNPVQRESLLSICENLLIVDSEGAWRFFHLSAREYFETAHDLTQPAFSFCAQVCFRSLINTFSPARTRKIGPPLPRALRDAQDTFDPFDEIHPFSEHVQTHWPFYALQQTEADESIIYLKQFLGSLEQSSPFFTEWADRVPRVHSLATFHSSKTFQLDNADISPTWTPIFAIAHFSLHKALRGWFDNQTFDPTQRNTRGESLLAISALNNCVPLCADLIERGVSVNQPSVSGKYGSVFAAAVSSGELEVVRYLVEKAQADANLLPNVGDYGSALAAAAAEKGYLEIVRYLVEEAQADANLLLQAGRYGSALAAAADSYEGNLEVVSYLVEEAQADANLLLQVGDYGSALTAAAYTRNLEVVRYLVEEAHADANLLLEVGNYGSALTAAACSGGLEVVRYLIEEAHADANLLLEVGNYGSALTAAAGFGYLEVVRYLVEEARADANLLPQVGSFGSALAAAAWLGYLEVVRYLVEEARADVNLLTQAGYYGSALTAAADSPFGGLEIVRYLVEDAQADANLLLHVGNHGSALAAAACSYHGGLEIVKYLVEKAQADVNLLPVSDGDYTSALGHAVEHGHMKKVQYLVEEGKADVNLQFRFKGSSTALDVALSKAALPEQPRPEEPWREAPRPGDFQAIAKYLISKGAVSSQ